MQWMKKQIYKKLVGWSGSESSVSWVVLNPESGKNWVPEGSILGPVLFKISISDLHKAKGCNFTKHADDTKLWRPVNTCKGWAAIQSALDRRDEGANINSMKLSQDKFTALERQKPSSDPGQGQQDQRAPLGGRPWHAAC